MKEEIKFRLAEPGDAAQIAAIYAPYVLHTNITYEYEVPSEAEFRRRIENIMQKYPYIVAIEGKEIIGYAYASTFRSRAAYDWDAEMSIYMKEGRQGCGIGSRLYDILENMLKAQHITNAIASITYPNPHSIAFHEKRGYKTVAHFTKCGYKAGSWCDMIFMEKMLNEHSIPAVPVIPFPELESAERFLYE